MKNTIGNKKKKTKKEQEIKGDTKGIGNENSVKRHKKNGSDPNDQRKAKKKRKKKKEKPMAYSGK